MKLWLINVGALPIVFLQGPPLVPRSPITSQLSELSPTPGEIHYRRIRQISARGV